MKQDPDIDAYKDAWTQSYDEMVNEKGLAAFFMRRGHALLEKDFGPEAFFEKVLEVGAGSSAHLPAVRHGFSLYCLTDIDTVPLGKAKGRLAADIQEKISVEKQDAAKLSYPDGNFDRLIATHVLEHLYRPHEVLREWSRVLKPGGVLSILLPCDPGLLWRLGRHFGPKAAAQAKGIDYDYWMAREHVNPVGNLVTFIRHYFGDVTERWYPLPLPFYDINLFYAVNITKKD